MESDAEGKRKRISLNDYKQRKSEPHESNDPRFNPGYLYYPYPSDSNRPAGLVAKDYSYERVGRRQITSREGGMGLGGKPPGEVPHNTESRHGGHNDVESEECRGDPSHNEEDAKTVKYDERRRDAPLNTRPEEHRLSEGPQSGHEILHSEGRRYPEGQHGSCMPLQIEGRGHRDGLPQGEERPDGRSHPVHPDIRSQGVRHSHPNGLSHPEIGRSHDEGRYPKDPNQPGRLPMDERPTNSDNQAIPPDQTNPDHRLNTNGLPAMNDRPSTDRISRPEDRGTHAQHLPQDDRNLADGRPGSHDRSSREEHLPQANEQRHYDDIRSQAPFKRRIQNDPPEGFNHPAKRPYSSRDHPQQQQHPHSQHPEHSHTQQNQHLQQHSQEHPQKQDQPPQRCPIDRRHPAFGPESKSDRRGKRSLDHSANSQSDSQTEGSDAERVSSVDYFCFMSMFPGAGFTMDTIFSFTLFQVDAYKHMRESRQRTSQGMRYLRRNLETIKNPRNIKGEKRDFQHWKNGMIISV